ncbi:ribonuclease III [bacterium]|nr:ribonuclease III [bacterium]
MASDALELTPERRQELLELCRSLDLPDVDVQQLNQAFTHRSFLNEHGFDESLANERLEFLGDAVLGVIVTDYLFHHYPELQEGQLSKIKSVVVSRRLLSRVARHMDLGRLLLLGRGEDQTGGRIRPSILANLFEALLGAVYLACGLETTRALVLRLLSPEIHQVGSGEVVVDYKSMLQELAQRRTGAIPRYRVTHTEGPDHDKVFAVEARLLDHLLGAGSGKNKKTAEQRAAADALERMNEHPGLLEEIMRGEN